MSTKMKDRPPGPPLPPTGRQLGTIQRLHKLPLIEREIQEHNAWGRGDLPMFLPLDALVYKPPIHSSNVKQYNACQRKFFLAQRCGFTRPSSHSSPLHTGKVFHSIIASLIMGTPRGDAIMVARSECNILAGKYEGMADRTGILPTGESAETVINRMKQDTDKAIAMAVVFDERYPVDPDRWEVVAVEEPVMARVRGIPRLIRGRLDLVLRERSTGWIWIMDHKTTSFAPWMLADSLTFDVQPQIYRLLAMAMFPDKHVVGMIHNLILKPTIKYCPDTKDRAGFASYIQRVHDWYEGRDAEAKLSKDATRLPMMRSEVRFRRTIPTDIFRLIADTGKACNRQATLVNYPRVADNRVCLGTYGSVCEFLPLCRLNNCKNWKQYLDPEKPYYVQLHRDMQESEC